MKRCEQCGFEVYGAERVCADCQIWGWKNTQQQADKTFAEKQAINECNVAYWRKRRRAAALYNGIKVAVIMLLVLAFIANVPNALHYEQTKYKRAIEHDAR